MVEIEQIRRPSSDSTASIQSSLKKAFHAVPPPALVFMSVVSTQVGAAWAKDLFSLLGAAGTVFLRVGFAAFILLIVWRPRVRGYRKAAYLYCVLFGIALAAMNFCFYSALARIPLGIAVTLEFVGPLAVAIVGSRRLLDVVWVIFAAGGISLLAPWTGASFNHTGVALALLAGGCWAAYIVCSALVGRTIPGVNGLAMAMVVAAILLCPIGVAGAGEMLFSPRCLIIGLAISLLSSVIPYSLEIEALRRLPTKVFGLLLSAEPAIAAVVGFLFLDEPIGVRGLVAIVLITAATIGSTRGHKSVN